MKGVLLFVFISGALSKASAQHSAKKQIEKQDTIFVGLGKTTYLYFSAPPSLVDIGNNDYVFKVEGKVLLVKSKVSHAQTTDMLVQVGEDVFTATVVYSTTSFKVLYDYRDKKSRENDFTWKHSSGDSAVFNSAAGQPEKLAPILDKVKRLLGKPIRFSNYGRIKSLLTFQVVDIRVDGDDMYIKCNIKNRSGIAYSLEFVSFEILRKGELRRDSRVLEPIYSPEDKSIRPKSEEAIVYVLPAFASDRNSSFIITFREVNGARKVELRLPQRAFDQVKPLEP